MNENVPVHQELDEWAFEIEKQLKGGTFTGSRGKLQRKLMSVWVARDRAFFQNKIHREKTHKSLVPISCKRRIMANNGGVMPPPAPPGVRYVDDLGRIVK